MILYDEFFQVANKQSSSIALQYDEVTLTYQELMYKIDKFIHWAQEIGVENYHSVAVMCHSRVNQAVLYFAASYLRIKLIYINFIIDSAESEWLHVLEDAAPDWIMCENVLSKATGSAGNFSLVAAEYPKKVSLTCETMPLFIQTYTSGTTGRPKGVCYREASVYNRSVNVTQMMKITSDSRVMITGHMFNMTGLTLCIGSLLMGARLVFISNKSDISIPEQIQKDEITQILLFPYQLNKLVHEETLTKQQFATLKLLAFGTAPTSSSVITKLREIITCEWLQGYGAVETCGPITWLTEEDISNEILAQSVGRAAPEVIISVIGKSGESLLPNTIGEIVVESPDLMLGYWDSALKCLKQSENAKKNRYRTGDMGYLNEQGYLFLKGRYKDCILLADGYTVFSAEVESVIAKLEGIIEVAVVGCDVLGDASEVTVAFVYTHLLDAVLNQFTLHLQNHLASKKWPQEIIFLRKPLLRNMNGKVMKQHLKNRYKEYGNQHLTLKLKESKYV